ncbi:MAG: 50S ribosomal protein L10 [Candidatus Paceibacterota bacterium]|jgi:large subunit ribosomal protein L10
MAIKKEKKVEIVSTIGSALKGAESIVFVNFNKLTVADSNTLRKNLREEGVGYLVAKKTLLKRVIDSLGISGDLPALDGQIAIAYAKDLLAPARGVYDFQKTHKDNLAIIGGVFEGKFMDRGQMESIATIPPREVLLSQIAYLLKSPMQRLAIAVNAVAGKKA